MLLGFQEKMKLYPGITFEDFGNIVGRELGGVRTSLGLVGDFSDVHRVSRFIRRWSLVIMRGKESGRS